MDNDGKDSTAVEVRYPLTAGQEHDRESWPWLPGVIEEQRGPDEWSVVIEDRAVAVLDDGSPAPADAADEDVLFPMCFRDSSEIREVAR